MLEKLLDALVSVKDAARPWEVVNVGHHAARLRFGKYHSTLAPGLHYKLPFVDELDHAPTNLTTHKLDFQTVLTKDNVEIVVRAIVRYQLTDLKAYTTNCYDQGEVLEDTAMGLIQQHIRQQDWTGFDVERVEKAVKTAMKYALGKFGFDIISLTFTDVGRMRSIRLLTASPDKQLHLPN